MWLFSVHCEISGKAPETMTVTITATTIECIYVKIHSNCFTYIIPLNLHHTPKRLVLSYK